MSERRAPTPHLSAEELLAFAQSCQDPAELKPHLLSISRLGRTLVELIALSWEDISPRPLQSALRELNITPRMAREYPIGDVIAELDDLCERGWLAHAGGAYRCTPALAHLVVARLSPQQLKTYWRHVMRLSSSALQVVLRAGARDQGVLSLNMSRVGRQLKRDLIFSLRQEPKREGQVGEPLPPLVATHIWSVYEPPELLRLWSTRALHELDERTLELLPQHVALWVRAERLNEQHLNPPELSAHTTRLSEELFKTREELITALIAFAPSHALEGPPKEPPLELSEPTHQALSGAERVISALSEELELSLREQGGRSPQGHPLGLLKAAGEALAELLITRSLLLGFAKEPSTIYERLEAHCAALVSAHKGVHNPRVSFDPTGRLRLWLTLSALSEGDKARALTLWTDGLRSFQRNQHALLGADARLTWVVSALCLYALKEPVGSLSQHQAPTGKVIEHELYDAEPHKGPLLAALSSILEAFYQEERPIEPARLHLLQALCDAPRSPLWELASATALAWSGLSEVEYEPFAERLKARAVHWRESGAPQVAVALDALSPSAAPTRMSALKEPAPAWLTQLNELEELARALLQGDPH